MRSTQRQKAKKVTCLEINREVREKVITEVHVRNHEPMKRTSRHDLRIRQVLPPRARRGASHTMDGLTVSVARRQARAQCQLHGMTGIVIFAGR